MDIVGLALVIISFTCGAISVRTAFKIYKTLETGFFQYLLYALVGFTMLPLGYLFQFFITDPAAVQVVTVGTLFFVVFAYISLGCIVAAVEYLKKRPNELKIDLSFLFAGIIIAERFLPAFQETTWNGSYWKMTFKFPLMITFAVFYLYVIVMTIPFLMRIWKHIREGQKFGSDVRRLFLLMIVALAYSAIALMINRGESYSNLDILVHPQGFLLFVSLGTILIYYILKESPTLFFSSTDEIIHLGIVRTKDNQPLVDYSFSKSEKEIQSFLVTGVQSTLKTIFQEAIQSGEELKQIRTGRDIVTIAIGRNVTGFIIAIRDIEVLGPLLVHTLSEFENKFGHEILARNSIPEFDESVESIFHFAIHDSQNPKQKKEERLWF
ncbi:MAG: hypothetical protein RTV31_05355 [Candidatus Thorarchaeota archaeon]